MTITILFKSGKEVSIKCKNVGMTRDTMTGRIDHLHFTGIKENQMLDTDFTEVAAIYRKVSDEVEE